MVYAPGNGCAENKNIQERMVQHTMRKNRLITVMMTAALVATAFAGCGNNEVATGAKPAVTESKTSGTTEVASEKETEQAYDPDDNTYNHLMSDPYFDMDNAIKDEEETEHLQRNHIEGEVFYNLIDMDRYMELTGAKVVEVNKTIDVEEARGVDYANGNYENFFILSDGGNCSEFYKHFAYYGINQYSELEFHLMDTTMNDYGTCYDSYETITVLKAYTVLHYKDQNPDGYKVVVDEARDGDEPLGMLCEVEADGEQGYMVLRSRLLSDYLGVDLSSVVDTDNE